MSQVKQIKVIAPCCGREVSSVYLFHKGQKLKTCAFCRQIKTIDKKVVMGGNTAVRHS